MSIRDIVNVQITRQTTPVSQRGFGVVMILGTHKVFNERIRYYQEADAILEDGFESTSPEYIAALAVLSQQPRPIQLAIGRRSVDDVVMTVATVADSTNYTTTINGTDFTINSGVGATAESIALALVGAINAGSEPVTAVDNVDGTYDLNADVTNDAWTLSFDENQTVADYVASDALQDDLTAVNEENDDWYGLVITSRVKQDVLDAAAWCEARIKLFGTASDDTDILDALSTTDIAFELSDAEYARTFVMYHDEAADIYPEAAWFGLQFPTPPGSTTWAFKTLATIPSVKLSATQRINAQNKNCNTYENRGGVSFAYQGKVAAGEFIDVIRGVDWLQARMTERIFSRLVNLPKIPYTDPGAAIVEAEIRAQLDVAIAQGLIAADPQYTVTIPKVADQAFNDRANRYFPNITFFATLAGAIHSLEVRGTVSV
jgi:hypothetical protein